MVWEESKNEREINKESRARGWKRDRERDREREREKQSHTYSLINDIIKHTQAYKHIQCPACVEK